METVPATKSDVRYSPFLSLFSSAACPLGKIVLTKMPMLPLGESRPPTMENPRDFLPRPFSNATVCTDMARLLGRRGSVELSPLGSEFDGDGSFTAPGGHESLWPAAACRLALYGDLLLGTEGVDKVSTSSCFCGEDASLGMRLEFLPPCSWESSGSMWMSFDLYISAKKVESPHSLTSVAEAYLTSGG